MTPVDSSWVGADNKLTPQKENGVYVARTYYAKFAEKEITINYVAVGPDGATDFGSVTPANEKVKVLTGTPGGSTPTAEDGFRFVGWFKDADCKQPVDKTWVANNKLTPGKTKNYGTESEPKMGYEAATYYAKFEPDVADLTITKTFPEKTCNMPSGEKENQSFIFHVKGLDEQNKNIEMDVVVKLGVNNNSVTIKGLKVGNYQVTEDSGWSWRYEVKSGEANPRNVEVKGGVSNTVTFTNTREMDKWLNGCSWAENNWASGKKKTDKNPDGETN